MQSDLDRARSLLGRIVTLYDCCYEDHVPIEHTYYYRVLKVDADEDGLLHLESITGTKRAFPIVLVEHLDLATEHDVQTKLDELSEYVTQHRNLLDFRTLLPR